MHCPTCKQLEIVDIRPRYEHATGRYTAKAGMQGLQQVGLEIPAR